MAEQDLSTAIRHVAAAVPDRECFVQGAVRRTYRDFTVRTDQLARVLHDAGLGCHRERATLAGHESGQDHLALHLHNSVEFLEANVGAFTARVAPFNVNYRYTATELEALLTDQRARAVVFHEAFAPTVAELQPRLPEVRLWLEVADGSGHGLVAGARWYHEALAAQPPGPPPVTPSPDDLYVLCTGGTTGTPKGVLWRQADIFVAALGGVSVRTRRPFGSYAELAEEAVERGGRRNLPTAPFMHGAAQWTALTALTHGNTVVVPSDVTRLDPADVWSTVERERVTLLQLVGDAFARPLLDELERHAYDLSSLKVVANGGAILSAEAKRRFLALRPGLLVADGLGSSEAGPVANQVDQAAPTAEPAAPAADPRRTTAHPDQAAGGVRAPGAGSGVGSGPGALADTGAGPTTAVFALGPGGVVLTADLDGVVPPGDPTVGWLATSGAIPLGYLGDPERTARTFPVVGGTRYAVPGDRARYRPDGLVELLGRDSVTINTGGEKVFAEEVEQALLRHPAVADAVVCGRPSERWGSEVVAVVALRPGGEATADELREAAAEHLARYKLPKAIVFRDHVARSPAGKADYAWARAQVTDPT